MWTKQMLLYYNECLLAGLILNIEGIFPEKFEKRFASQC